MRIETGKSNLCLLGDLGVGDVFQDGKEFYIRTDERDSVGDIGVVNLDDGCLYYEFSDSYVIPVKAKVVIE